MQSQVPGPSNSARYGFHFVEQALHPIRKCYFHGVDYTALPVGLSYQTVPYGSAQDSLWIRLGITGFDLDETDGAPSCTVEASQ